MADLQRALALAHVIVGLRCEHADGSLDLERTRLAGLLEPTVLSAVERDPVKWQQYCLRPAGYMGVVRTPESPFARLLTREVEMFLDFDVGQQQDDGAWHPSWDWGSRFPQEWDRARQAWQGILTLDRLITFKRFGRLTEK